MADVPRLSVGQLGRIREEFRRIGLGDDERPWRLAASATLLGIPGQPHSTKDLTAAQARQLRVILAQFDSEADLEAAVAAVRRERQRAKFFNQLAVALSRHD